MSRRARAMNPPARGRAFRTLVFGWLVAACHAGSPRLEGHWRGVRVEGLSGEPLATGNAFALRTELRVSGNTLTVTRPGETQSGRFRVMRDDESGLTITTDQDGLESPQTFTFEGPSTLRWAILPGKSMVFIRTPE